MKTYVVLNVHGMPGGGKHKPVGLSTEVEAESPADAVHKILGVGVAQIVTKQYTAHCWMCRDIQADNPECADKLTVYVVEVGRSE